MGRLHIVTDSNCHIPPDLCHELNITVIPLPFAWDGTTYLDSVDIGPREFYSRLRLSETLPTTSAPTPGSFKTEFERLAADGRPLLAILVGKDFSSTYLTAGLAREMVPEADIRILNSSSNTMGLGFQVLAAARAALAGKTADEVIEVVEQVQDKIGVVFAVRDVSYLRRGGRISRIQGFFGEALNLIPIMELRGGPIRPVERLRSEAKLTSRLLELVSVRVQDARPVRMAVVHADSESAAWNLMAATRERFHPDELIMSELSPVVGIHVGPDALGIAYSSGV
jgi:DegV family protein with EDD domain